MYKYHKINHEYFRMEEVAKKLNIKGYGRNNLFKFLKKKGVINQNNWPFEQYVESGFFKPVINPVHAGIKFSSGSCRVSEDGIEFIRKLIESEMNELE